MNKLEYALITVNSILGVSITLEDARNILGIIILAFQVLLIIYNVILKIWAKIKNKDFEGIKEDIEDTIEDLQELNKEEKK